VLKCTHDSGGVVICKDKKDFNFTDAKEKLEKSLESNFYLKYREWAYKNIKPRIIAEEYIEDESKCGLNDYKFFVFNGKVKIIYIVTGRNTTKGPSGDFYDRDFNHLPIRDDFPNSLERIKKPYNYNEMIECAEKLGQSLIHARIDFYNVNGKVYFGEITLYPSAGLTPFVPEKWDYVFGNWIKLPNKSNN